MHHSTFVCKLNSDDCHRVGLIWQLCTTLLLPANWLDGGDHSTVVSKYNPVHTMQLLSLFWQCFFHNWSEIRKQLRHLISRTQSLKPCTKLYDWLLVPNFEPKIHRSSRILVRWPDWRHQVLTPPAVLLLIRLRINAYNVIETRVHRGPRILVYPNRWSVWRHQVLTTPANHLTKAITGQARKLSQSVWWPRKLKGRNLSRSVWLKRATQWRHPVCGTPAPSRIRRAARCNEVTRPAVT